MIPMSQKNQYLYDKIFKSVIYILEENVITQKDIPNKFMCDFERVLINSIKSNFKDAMIVGCFYHYIKLLWGYTKKFGLCKKKILKVQNYLGSFLKLCLT